MSCPIDIQNKNAYPYEINIVGKELNQELLDHFTGEGTAFIQVGKEKWMFPSKYSKGLTNVYNFEVRPDDTWIITYPRSGTTMMQEIIWLLANNLNYEEAASTSLHDRFPFIESSVMYNDRIKNSVREKNANIPGNLEIIESLSIPKWEALNQAKSPRFIKTHMPISLLPPKLLTSGCKIFYLARNPKDVAVSYYHLHRLFIILGFDGGFAKFWEYFQNDLVSPSPYWNHVKEGWIIKDRPNVQFLFYEDIVKGIPGIISKVAKFLGKSYDPEQINKLADYASIESAKKRTTPIMNHMREMGLAVSGEQDFVRKGVVGGWSEEFTPELNEIADKWISENLAKIDMRFPV